MQKEKNIPMGKDCPCILSEKGKKMGFRRKILKKEMRARELIKR